MARLIRLELHTVSFDYSLSLFLPLSLYILPGSDVSLLFKHGEKSTRDYDRVRRRRWIGTETEKKDIERVEGSVINHAN